MYKKSSWFTLVELIVTITILAVLSTISYMSFWNITTTARDGKREASVNSIEKVLSARATKVWIYPKPSNAVDITYSWWVVFSQWTFWDSVQREIWWQITKIPKDPLYDTEYTYSTSFKRTEYSISYIREEPLDTAYLRYKSANANDLEYREFIWKVKWNYNGQLWFTNTWWINYVFWLPSIVLSDLSETDINNIWDKFVYNWESVIADIYKDKVISPWVITFTPQLVYSWTTLPRSQENLAVLIDNLQNNYIWTEFYSNPNFKNLIELDLSDANELHDYGSYYINHKLWGQFILEYPKDCNAIKIKDSNAISWDYTISPDWSSKIDVYCDMETNWWGRTRLSRWEHDSNSYTYLLSYTEKQGLSWSKVMAKYKRYGKIRVDNWDGTSSEYDFENLDETYAYEVERLDFRKYNSTWLCYESNSINSMVSHLTKWTWWNCGTYEWFNWLRADWLWILYDDLWKTWGGISSYPEYNDDISIWISSDPCLLDEYRDSWLIWFNDLWQITLWNSNPTNTVYNFLWWNSNWCNVISWSVSTFERERDNNWWYFRNRYPDVWLNVWWNLIGNYAEYASWYKFTETYIK